MSKPSAAQIQALYNATLAASGRFAAYNFKSYFTRRTQETFAPVLASLNIEPSSSSPSSSTPKAASASEGILGEVDLAKFYEEKSIELEVIKRAGELNKVFEGPKLVVEHARPITAGGGAGAEASP